MSKRNYKASAVQIWFLDEDPVKSARYLTDIALDKTLDGCFAALTCALFYFIGIRTKKAYGFYFSNDRRQETLDRYFPLWPYRKPPQLRYYTSRASRWVRQCREHFDYTVNYAERLLDEWEYRKGRQHKISKFVDWLKCDSPDVNIPSAGLKKISLPWKNVKKKFRRQNIVDGYRLQYIDTFCWDDPLAAYANINRDIPEFISDYFKLDAESAVT